MACRSSGLQNAIEIAKDTERIGAATNVELRKQGGNKMSLEMLRIGKSTFEKGLLPY